MLSTLSLAFWCALLPAIQAGEETLPKDDALPKADPAVTRAELEHHVRFLASDELAGREPLTQGMERASQYLARALKEAGIEPAGEDGTYFENTGLQRFDYPEVPRLLLTDEAGEVHEARYGADFLLRVRGAAHSTEKLPLRFFYDYNHARMPLEGEPGEAIYFSGPSGTKRRILTEKGIENLEDWGLEIEVMPTNQDRPGQPKKAMAPRLATAGAEEPEGCELVELRGPIAEPFEARKYAHIQLLVEERRQPFEDHNVVGRIRGVGTAEHPEWAHDVVILSAHYDHLGVREAPRGREREDSIFNGADDDASGCAVLLEVAQAIASGAKPVRTVIVLFTTGEESGGKGIRRYISAPPEPLAKTVMNLNFEMLGRPDEKIGGAGKLWLTGAERTGVGFGWHDDLGIQEIVPDPRPDQSFFERSDNYALALEGVVAQTLSSFGMHREYHTPRDNPDTLDYEHLAAAAEVCLRASKTLTDAQIFPAWIGPAPEKKKTPQRTGPRTEEQRQAERERRKAEAEQRELGDGNGSGGEDENGAGDGDDEDGG